MKAKGAARKLHHPCITSEHLLYARLRLHDQRHWALCRDLSVNAESVWSHLEGHVPAAETFEDFHGVPLGASAKAALERAESEATRRGTGTTGTESLMNALLSEKAGPVRSLLDANKDAAQSKT